MKVVILCGGYGTRISEETHIKPKPMIEIGQKPILLHIMQHYASYGFKDFVLALGYKSEYVKEYFLNFYSLNCDFTVRLGSGKVDYLNTTKLDWNVTLVDTGLDTLTGGRLLRLQKHLMDGPFMVTYGDGLCDINLQKLTSFHKEHRRMATVTAVRPAARFGGMELKGSAVKSFQEKPQGGEGWINGGFFVMEPGVFKFFDRGDETILERSPMEGLTAAGELMAYQHTGFWQCMDTLRDKNLLEDLWKSGKAPWTLVDSI